MQEKTTPAECVQCMMIVNTQCATGQVGGTNPTTNLFSCYRTRCPVKCSRIIRPDSTE